MREDLQIEEKVQAIVVPLGCGSGACPSDQTCQCGKPLLAIGKVAWGVDRAIVLDSPGWVIRNRADEVPREDKA